MNCEIGNAANLHVMFSISNCDYFEYWVPQAAHQCGIVDDIHLNDKARSRPQPGLGSVTR